MYQSPLEPTPLAYHLLTFFDNHIQTQRFKSLAEIHFAETSSTIGWRRNPTLVKTSKANACLAHTHELEVNRIAGPLIMPPQV